MTTDQNSNTAQDETRDLKPATPTFKYENEAFSEDGDKTVKANGGLAQIVNATTAATKWKDLARTRRFMLARTTHTGLDLSQDELSQETENGFKGPNLNQRKLNQKLIKHFVELQKLNSDEDVVDFDLIEKLIKDGADVNCADKHGQTLLHEAARTWHTDVALFLIEQGADINKADRYGRTALHIAAATNYPEMVAVLVEKGANIEVKTREEDQTPLHFAARNDATDSLKVLIKLGANRECKDFRRRTPLFVAAELDRSDTARFLIDINADATVIDDAGQSCMTHMITNMGPVARQALDQFHRKDRANRKQYFFLNLLESMRIQGKGHSLAKTPLEVIVTYRQLDLIMHPVIMRLIDVKWKLFGRRRALQALFLNLFFVIVWTILGVGVPWFYRRVYNFPSDGWRVAFLVLGCLMATYYVVFEIREIFSSREKFTLWKEWREKQINRDLQFCHPKWPEEEKYLKREVDCLDEMLPSYFRDFWNYFDWTVYFLIFSVVIIHIVDVATPQFQPFCCLNAACNNSLDPSVCQDGFVNNLNLSVWNNRIFVCLVICLWLRLMKDTRAFRFLGPFIVMLGKMTWDIVRFVYLYLEFYIPYSCAFWMIFGNLPLIDSMSTVDRMLFSLYRITLVDDYQFNEMQAYDIVMAYILVGTFLGISAILCINLFIALLSDTFQRVYDNANANAVMQQATLMLNIEESLSLHLRKRVRKYIESKGSPEELYYDDDLTVAQDADLKKVTIQIKDQMDELLEHVHQSETDKRLADDSLTTPRSGRPTMKKTLSDVFAVQKAVTAGALASQTGDAMAKIQRRVGDVTSLLKELQEAQSAQEQSQKRLRNDVKEIKQLLWKLVRSSGSGGGSDEREEQDRSASSSSTRAPSRGPITVDVMLAQRSGVPIAGNADSSNIFQKRRKEPVNDEVLARMVAPVPSEPEPDVRLSPITPEMIEMSNLPGSARSSRGSSSQPITVDVRPGQGSAVSPDRADSSDA